MNRVEIMGTLTREPKYHITDSGYPILSFTLAVNEAGYDAETKGSTVSTIFVAVQAFGSLANELAEEGWGQGDDLIVIGRLTQQEVMVGTKKDRKTRVQAYLVSRVRGRPTRRPEPEGL